ncbi:MAG TPA: DUF1684 domain-containing protein [Ktedonobacterales bacterium]|nr:DUF1684 domain-containing protein [Ktedonobacterales bacterium]
MADMTTSANAQPTWLDLYDYRRRVADLYRERERAYREGVNEEETLRRFRVGKDALFARHPQSALPVEERERFDGLRYYPYAPELRVEAILTPLKPEPADTEGEPEPQIEASGPHTMRFRPAARASFTLGQTPTTLTLYWIDVYGGGLFLAFRDATCPAESYGGGRYLFDSVKGSEPIALDGPGEGAMGYSGGRILLDFNYAYNPSCAYDPRWVCPLAPRENHLPMPIRAGERRYHP